jgi:GT2 family glycosyltransferase
MGTDVTVVIGNYQGEHLLPDCLASLKAQTQPPVEVIVVDASSTDASIDVARAHHAHVLRHPNNGLGFLYNRGAAAAGSSFVLFLNNDVALAHDCIAQLASALAEDPSRFAADAHQLDWEGRRTIHARTTLRRGRLIHEYLPGLHLDSVAPADSTVATVCANGAAMLVRHDLFRELGGFDETFFMEWEDLDLCWRAWLRGWATVYVPSASLRHKVGAATNPAMAPRRQSSSHHNILRFALKCLPVGAATRVFAGELLRWPRYPRAIGRALAAVAVEIPEILRLRRTTRPSQALLDAMLDGRLVLRRS